jgi:hypothetical protein
MSKMKIVAVVVALVAIVVFIAGFIFQPKELTVSNGSGQTSVFRVGPGKDAAGGQIYSISTVTADATFDKEGKIISVHFDALEVLSPNDSEHEGAPRFSGWPGQAGYLTAPASTVEIAAKEVSEWQTKLERGDAAYGMNISEQYAVYEEFFKGKTVAEVEAWFAKNTSDKNGRPLKANSTDPDEQAKYSQLTDEEKQVLADVTSGASVSLKDAHGDFIGALKKAYDSRAEVKIPVK